MIPFSVSYRKFKIRADETGIAVKSNSLINSKLRQGIEKCGAEAVACCVKCVERGVMVLYD